MSTLKIRPYQSGDEESINRSFNSVFRASRSLAEWRWKFLDNPLGHAIVIAKLDQGPVVSHFAAIPTLFRVDTEFILIGQGVDAFRLDLGPANPISRTLYDATEQKFEELFCRKGPLTFLYGLAGERHTRVLTNRLGWTALGKIQPWSSCVPSKPRLGRFVSVVTGFQPSLWADLWERSAHLYRVRAVRDLPFVKWRLLGHPLSPYSFYFVVRGHRAEVGVVLRLKGETCYLVDLLWSKASPEDLEVAFKTALRLAFEWGTSRVVYWFRGDEEQENVLQHLGWRPANDFSDITITAVSFDPRLSTNAFWEGVFLTMADGDIL